MAPVSYLTVTCSVMLKAIPEENLAKSKSSMLPESKMDSDYTAHYRKH